MKVWCHTGNPVFFHIFAAFWDRWGTIQDPAAEAQWPPKTAKMVEIQGIRSIFRANEPENTQLHPENAQATSQQWYDTIGGAGRCWRGCFLQRLGWQARSGGGDTSSREGTAAGIRNA